MKINQFIKKDKNILVVVFLSALLFRVAIFIVLAWDSGLHFENAQIAQYIIQGQGYAWDWYGQIPPQPTAILPPIYTYFLAFFLAFFNDPARWIYISQAVLNSIVIIPAFYLGKLLWDRKTGIVAAATFAFFPEIAFGPTKMVSEPLLIPLIIFILVLYLKAKNSLYTGNAGKCFFRLGCLLGLAALVKASAFFILISFGLGIIISNGVKRPVFKPLLLMAIGFCIVISPWSIRNTIVFNKFVPMRTMYGFNLWRGNHPGATGTPRINPTTPVEAALDSEYKEYIEKNHPLTELGIDAFYRDEAIKFIKANPGEFVRLTLKRALYFFTFDPTHPLTRNIVYIAGHLFLLWFGFWGALIMKKNRMFDNIFILIPLVSLLFYMPVVILPRYRLFLTLMLMLLSTIPIATVFLKSKRFDYLNQTAE